MHKCLWRKPTSKATLTNTFFKMGARYNIAEIEISYKYNVCFAEREKISSSNCAYKIGLEYSKKHLEHFESFNIIFLNNSNHVLGVSQISKGGITGTLCDIRIIFQNLLKANAVAFIAYHNHPSGTLHPSEADKALTKKLIDAGKFLDIKMLDHLIITPDSYFSFADEGML